GQSVTDTFQPILGLHERLIGTNLLYFRKNHLLFRNTFRLAKQATVLSGMKPGNFMHGTIRRWRPWLVVTLPVILLKVVNKPQELAHGYLVSADSVGIW